MEGHRDDNVGLRHELGPRTRHHGAESASELQAVAEFKPVHQGPRGAVVQGDRAGTLEDRGSDTAAGDRSGCPQSTAKGVPRRSQ